MKRRKARELVRKRGTRVPAVRVTIVMEGAVTEPEYLLTFGQHFLNQTVRLNLIGGAGDPRSVVERAIEERRMGRGGNSSARDAVWAMFDRDEHLRFSEAIDLAAANNIEVVISNPCFELWGIYHYRDYNAPIDRHQCQRVLQDLCPEYDRHKNKVFGNLEVIGKFYAVAVGRARASIHNREKEGAPGSNPCTNVHVLTEYVRGLVR